VLAALATFAKPEMFRLPVVLARSAAPQLGVLRADHGGRGAQRAAAPAGLVIANRRIVEGIHLSGLKG
jgi:hypothetical protein